MNSARFAATIEFLCGQWAAIITLTDSTGEWSGASRIDVRHIAFENKEAIRERLYEIGYLHAEASAIAKGGTLDAYRTVQS